MNSKIIFDEFRIIAGGKLTQAQVDKIQALINEFSTSKKTSDSGVNLICGFEGLRLNAYDDGVGVWTIGYGTTVYPNSVKVKRGDTCTTEQAKQYMKHDLVRFENTVNSVVKVLINQNQFDALVSLAYNIGAGALSGSTLVKKLNSGDVKGASDQFLVWNKAGGKVMQGLVNRRQKERSVFLS